MIHLRLAEENQLQNQFNNRPWIEVILEKIIGKQAMTDTCQVRDGGELRLALNAEDEIVRAVSRAAAGAVSDRHERRLELLQRGDIAKEILAGFVGLRGEEFEAELRRVVAENIENVHGGIVSRHHVIMNATTTVLGRLPVNRRSLRIPNESIELRRFADFRSSSIARNRHPKESEFHSNADC